MTCAEGLYLGYAAVTQLGRNRPATLGRCAFRRAVTKLGTAVTRKCAHLQPPDGVTDVTDGVTDGVTALGVLRRVAVTTLADGLEQVTGRN